MQSHARRGMRSRTILLPVEKTFQPVLWLHCPNELFDLIGAAADGAHTWDKGRARLDRRKKMIDKAKMLRGSCQGDIGKRPERKLPKSFAEGTTHWTSQHFKGVTCQHEDEHEAEIYRWMKGGKIIHQSLFLPISVRQKDLAPWSMQNLPAWFRREAMGPPQRAYNFAPWNRSVEEGNGVQEYYLRSKTCHKGTPKECLPPPLVHFSSLCIFTSLSEPLSV